MYDRKTVRKIIEHGRAAEIDALELLSLPLDEIVAEYNGVGPAMMPESWREKATEHLRIFLPAVAQHDLRYSRGDRTRSDWRSANMQFLYNCLKLANIEYAVSDWRRYRAWAAAFALYRAVATEIGRAAYLEGCNTNTKNKVK